MTDDDDDNDGGGVDVEDSSRNHQRHEQYEEYDRNRYRNDHRQRNDYHPHAPKPLSTTLQRGVICSGVVSRIEPYGAFISLDTAENSNNRTHRPTVGLAHISQLAPPPEPTSTSTTRTRTRIEKVESVHCVWGSSPSPPRHIINIPRPPYYGPTLKPILTWYLCFFFKSISFC